jgi:DNA-binding response OmpR family regulator
MERWTDWGSTVSYVRTILSICSDIFSQYRRCAFLREHGWLILSSTSGHGGIVQFAAELVDVVVLDVDGDGAETAVIAWELKRTKAGVPVILLVGERQALVEGVVECADAVVPRLDESELLNALEQQVGHPTHAVRPA